MICILPTDTCYGLSGSLTQEDFDGIYALKGRDIQKKLAFLVRDFSELRNIALVSDEQLRILRSYPYPFSVLLPPNPHYSFPDFIKLDSYQYISVRI